MFEIYNYRVGSKVGHVIRHYCIRNTDDIRLYLHSNGSVFIDAAEYWPTQEGAQIVLDKYYPKPKHVWEHGDVFKTRSGVIMMFHSFCAERKSEAICIVGLCNGPAGNLEEVLQNAKFLFNIEEKL